MDNRMADRATLDAIQEKLGERDGCGSGVCGQRALPGSQPRDRGHLCLKQLLPPMPPRDATKEIGFGDAVREAIAEEMRRDPTVILMGEDVAEAGTTFKVLKGLVEEFGPTRIIDTPISEVGFTGLCVGAAMTGCARSPTSCSATS